MIVPLAIGDAVLGELTIGNCLLQQVGWPFDSYTSACYIESISESQDSRPAHLWFATPRIATLRCADSARCHSLRVA